MGHTPKTEIGRLARAYREHEHEPDYIDVHTYGDDDELEDSVPSDKTDIATAMQRIIFADTCDQGRHQKLCQRSKGVGRHGRSRKVHIPTHEGEIATDSHGRFRYVLGPTGKKITHGRCMVKVKAETSE